LLSLPHWYIAVIGNQVTGPKFIPYLQSQCA